jgi:hypothetical protein
MTPTGTAAGLDSLQACHICARTGLTAAHICAGTCLEPAARQAICLTAAHRHTPAPATDPPVAARRACPGLLLPLASQRAR